MTTKADKRIKGTLGNTGSPGRWQAWVLKQDKVWVNLQGDVIELSSIEGRYALNILKFVWRLHSKDIPDTSVLCKALEKIVKRDMGLYSEEIATLMFNQAEPPYEDNGYDYLHESDFFDWEERF